MTLEYFLNVTQKAQAMKEKQVGNLDFNIKNYCALSQHQ